MTTFALKMRVNQTHVVQQIEVGTAGDCLPRRPPHLSPSFLDLLESHDVASIICQA